MAGGVHSPSVGHSSIQGLSPELAPSKRERSGSSGQIFGHSMKTLPRSNSAPLLTRVEPHSKDNNGPRLSEHRVEHEGQFGLKFFKGDKGDVERFGQRYDRAIHGDELQIGPYRVVGDKSRGVEPGFIGRKAWTDGDTEKMSKPGHKFCTKTDTLLRQNLNSLGGNNFQIRKQATELAKALGHDPGKQDIYRYLRSHPDVERQVFDHMKQGTEPRTDAWLRDNLNSLGGNNFHVRKQATEVAKGLGFDPGKQDIYRFLRSNPGIERQVFDQMKQEGPPIQKQNDPIQKMLIGHIMTTEPKFTKNHYVKLDYRETERSGSGTDKTYTLPTSNAKSFGFGAIGKFFHKLCRRQTPDNINRDAMRESVANDLMKSFGIFAQKLKLVPTTYQDGTAKLLLDGTHMTGPNGEKFSDFEGSIVGKSPNGQLVKIESTNPKKPDKNDRGHHEVDTSINEMGRNKIFMLLLGDRDAIGSKGGNKGRVGNTFAAIDPGHSLELGGQRLMEKHDIHSDMSFDQPSRMAGKCYKNFTIFDQSPFSERMEGVRKLKELSETGEDMRVFDDYAKEFNKDKQPGMDFEQQISEMRDAYKGRRDYILNDVFAERLQVYDYDMSGVGDANAQETAKKQTLDVLDTLEKITSKRSWMSGNTELAYPIVKERTEWNVSESANGENVEFSVANPSRSARRELEAFMDHAGIPRDNLVERDDGSLVISVPKTEMGTAFENFSIEKLRAYDEVPEPQLG